MVMIIQMHTCSLLANAAFFQTKITYLRKSYYINLKNKFYKQVLFWLTVNVAWKRPQKDKNCVILFTLPELSRHRAWAKFFSQLNEFCMISQTFLGVFIYSEKYSGNNGDILLQLLLF